jgi:hypothetical protein
MVLIKELMRFQRLADQGHPITEPHRFLNFASDDAYGRVPPAPGGLDVFPPGVLANTICVCLPHAPVLA